MPTLDVFKGSAFSATTLSSAFALREFVPSKINDMGLFESKGVRTTTIMVENIKNTITLIPSTPRGGAGIQNKKDKRNSRKYDCPHFQLDDRIGADEIQNIRAFGSENELKAVKEEVDERSDRIQRSIDATIEYQRMGALQGIVYDVQFDSNGVLQPEVLLNFFTEFGISQPEVNFNLNVAATEPVTKSTEVVKKIETELGMLTFQGVLALCSDGFFNALITHANVKEAYNDYLRAAAKGAGRGDIRADDVRYTGFYYGGVLYQVYRGQIGAIPFVTADEAVAFPVGVPGLFVSAFAPADLIDFVNTMGLPRYLYQYPTEDKKAIMLQGQTNHFPYCTVPGTLIRLKKQ